MKKIVLGFIGIVLLGAGLAGCAPGEKKEATTKDIQRVRLGVMPSTDNIPFLMAQKAELDKAEGVKIELEVFKSGQDRDAAFQAGEVDGVISDLVGLALYTEGGMAVQTVGAPYDEFDLVTSDPAIKTVADLKGKSVDYSELTGTAYAVDMMAKDAGLSLSDIKSENIAAVPTRLERLAAKQTAAAILPEPFVTIAKTKGMSVVKTTNDLGINPFAIIFSTDFINKHPKGIEGMIKAYNTASKEITKTKDEAILDLFIKDVGFPEETKEQIEIPDFGTMAQVKESDMTSALTWAKDKGLLTKDVAVDDVMNDDFIN